MVSERVARHGQSHVRPTTDRGFCSSAIRWPSSSQQKCEMHITAKRAENGGLDPSWLDLAFSGRPDFQFRGPQILVLKGLGSSGWKIGAPQKRQIQPRRIQAPMLGPLSYIAKRLFLYSLELGIKRCRL